MRIAPLADVKARLSAYVEQCETDGPVIITRNGKAVAVLLAPVDDDDLESLILARSPRFQASQRARGYRGRISGKPSRSTTRRRERLDETSGIGPHPSLLPTRAQCPTPVARLQYNGRSLSGRTLSTCRSR